MKTYKGFINKTLEEGSIAFTGHNGNEVAVITGSKSALKKVSDTISHEMYPVPVNIMDGSKFLDKKGEPMNSDVVVMSASNWLKIK